MTSEHHDGPMAVASSRREARRHRSGASRAPRHTRPAFAVALALTVLAGDSGLHAQSPRDSVAVRITADSARLARLVERARLAGRDDSPALRAARSARDLAVARAAATGHLAPATLSAGLSEAPAANIDQGNLRLEVGRDLMTGPRRRAERSVADIEVRAAEVALSVEERRRDAALLRDLLRAAGARRVAERLTSEDQVLLGADEGVRGRFSVGQARYVDVLRVRTERLRVQTERSSALAESRAARAVLLAPLRAHSTRREVQAVIDSLTADPGDAWRALLPEALPLDSLIALTEAVQLGGVDAERARRERDLVLAEQRAQVNAYAGIQRIGQANNGPTLGPSFGVSVSLPFTAARGNRLALGAADQRIVTANASSEAARAEARARAEAGLERYTAARARLETFDAALLRGAREERESALAAYRTGSLTLLELLDFERALARAEIERIHALVDAADAWADLMGAEEAGDARPLTASEAR